MQLRVVPPTVGWALYSLGVASSTVGWALLINQQLSESSSEVNLMEAIPQFKAPFPKGVKLMIRISHHTSLRYLIAYMPISLNLKNKTNLRYTDLVASISGKGYSTHICSLTTSFTVMWVMDAYLKRDAIKEVSVTLCSQDTPTYTAFHHASFLAS